ncbi:MAG: hypothetical protein Kow0092_07930 [Deferrisomatales bacterium]
MDLRERSALVERFFAGTAGSYDRIVQLGTLGLDGFWKRRILARLPPDPRWVVDQAAGTGIVTFRIARRFPRCRVVGVELRAEYARAARRKQRRSGPRNVQFVVGRAEEVLVRAPVDAVTSSYLAKYAEVERWVATAAAMLRPGGVFVAHDFTVPTHPVWRRAWRLWLAGLQRAGVRRFPEWRQALLGLPGLLEQTAWVEDLSEALVRRGFRRVTVERLAFGAAALVTARRQGHR